MAEYKFTPELLKRAIDGFARKAVESLSVKGSYSFVFEDVIIVPIYAKKDDIKSNFSDKDLDEIHFIIDKGGFIWKVWLYSNGTVITRPKIRKDYVEHMLHEFSRWA